ncbi:MAG TPA: hypothetical protein VMU47_20885 [Caldimonas sp.]|nr:hypothetical protein [Caldimonas sp.]
MLRTRLAALAATFAAVACATAPLSFVDGRPFGHATLNRYPVRIVAVDGQSYFREPVAVGPGPHTIVAEAAPGSGPNLRLQKAFVLNIEPCTHYHLAADRESPLLAEWTPVVESKDKVGECNPEQELRKAQPRG